MIIYGVEFNRYWRCRFAALDQQPPAVTSEQYALALRPLWAHGTLVFVSHAVNAALEHQHPSFLNTCFVLVESHTDAVSVCNAVGCFPRRLHKFSIVLSPTGFNIVSAPIGFLHIKCAVRQEDRLLPRAASAPQLETVA